MISITCFPCCALVAYFNFGPCNILLSFGIVAYLFTPFSCDVLIIDGVGILSYPRAHQVGLPRCSFLYINRTMLEAKNCFVRLNR